MATDKFSTHAPKVDGVAVRSEALDVSGADQTLTDIPSGFLCTTAGNVIGKLKDDTADRTFAVLAGVVYPFRFKFIEQTGTTAAGLFLYTA